MREDLQKQNLIVQLSFDFAVHAISFCSCLDSLKKWSLSNQLLRAALSIGANIREAQNAESKADFIHKMKIAAKEAEEVDYYVQRHQNYRIRQTCYKRFNQSAESSTK